MWIEGGVDVGVLSGFTDGTYKPNSTISRQQANNILGSYLSKKELAQKGSHHRLQEHLQLAERLVRG